MRRTKRVAVCFSVVGLISAALVAPAQAGPSDPVSGTGEIEQWTQEVGTAFLDNQEALSDYAGWLNEHPEMEDDGFVAPDFDIANKRVTLLWKDGSTAQQQALSEAKARGLGATVKHYPMSVKEITAAQDKVWADQSPESSQASRSPTLWRSW